MIPGEIFPADGTLELNAGLPVTTLTIANTGDRPIQVGSHYHFFETNDALKFDRKRAKGMRLDIAAGTAVPSSPITASATSLAEQCMGSTPSTVKRIVRLRRVMRVCVASTCSSSDVPMPNASAPSAQCVLVCESPQTIVMPGSVLPRSGATTCTMPWCVCSMP